MSKKKKDKKINKKDIFIIILASILTGFTNGFFGGGGGMLCVPLLESSLKIDNKKAHATTIAVIVPLSLMSSVVYIFKNEMDWMKVLFVSIGVATGGFLGAMLLKKLNSKIIRSIFAIVMCVAGILIIYK